MSAPTFATPTELNLTLGREIDEARADFVLRLTSALIRSELRQAVDRVTDTVRLLPRGGVVLMLPELPAWDIVEVVEVRGGGEVTLVAGDDYRAELGPDGRVGILRRLRGYSWPLSEPSRPYYDFWPGAPFPGSPGVISPTLAVPGDAYVSVEYDHGYDLDDDASGGDEPHPLPDTIKLVALRVAARGITNPAGMRQETISRYSYTAAGAGDSVGLTLTAGDVADLAAFYPGTRSGARG